MKTQFDKMIAAGYLIQWQGTGEAEFIKPDGTRYETSIVGFGFKYGCTCPAQSHGAVRCKHKIVVLNVRPCHDSGCGGHMKRYTASNIITGGSVEMWECDTCGVVINDVFVQERIDVMNKCSVDVFPDVKPDSG